MNKIAEDPELSTSHSLALRYSCAGHFLFHYFTAMYFTLVLALSRDWQHISYENLIALWTPASILVGLLALPAGRFADRWSSSKMMIVMFIGMGLATTSCGFAGENLSMMLLLALIGIFGAIYHPVGIPWLIRNSVHRTGLKLAVNGVFGGLGAAAAGGGTGLLIEGFGWQWAFFIPGTVCVLTGISMLYCVKTGLIRDGSPNKSKADRDDEKGNINAFLMLLVPMFVIGLIYNTVQVALPKLFEEEMPNWLGGDILQIGMAVTGIYTVSAAMQLVGGMLADRYPLKLIYLISWLIHIPMLLLMANLGETALFLSVMILVVANSGALPSENMMLSRFAPAAHQGLAFGIKFVVVFGAAPIGIWLIKVTRQWTGDFSGLLIGLGVTVLLIIPFVLLLPRDTDRKVIDVVS